ncbi:exosortase F system-associated protein [Flavobacterium sp.]|uniref:exosortase F system-associated membrane protein n=1 Tax=Flavobacterium sp. TaxID=239 RepID=UPI003341EDD7
MLKNLLQNKTKVFYILLLFSFLVVIRAYENTIFYDPLLAYFKKNYMQTPLPELNVVKLFFSMGFRFYLNSIISIGLLKVLFDDSKVVKFSIFLYSVFGILFMVTFFFIILKFGETNKMNLFYIRRFIIQPLLLILFIPAFYYQKKITN